MKAYPKMTALARLFPTLEAAPVEPFDAQALERWALDGACSGAVHAARFLLELYNARADWKVGPFVVTDAFSTWDEAHQAGFVSWCRAPFFP